LVPLLALYFLYIPWRNGNSYYNKCFSIATWEVTFLPIATVVAYMVSYFISAVCPESYGGLGKSNAWKSLSFELISQISNTSLQDMFRFCIAMFGVGIYLHCVNGMQLYSPSFNLKGPSEGSFYLFYSGGANATLWISKACEFGGACDWVEQRDCGCFSSGASNATVLFGTYGDYSRLSSETCSFWSDLFDINWDELSIYEKQTWVLCTLYVVDIVVRMMAFAVVETRAGRSIIRTPRLADCADIVSAYSVLIAAAIESDEELAGNLTNEGFSVLLWFSFFRVLRLVHICKWLEDAAHKYDERFPDRTIGSLYFPEHFCGVSISASAVSILKIVLLLFTYICATAALVLACEYPCPIIKDCFITPDGGFFDDCNCNAMFRSYFRCIYFVVVTFSTVGYGDMYPSTNRSRAVIMGCIACGVTLIPYLLGMLSESINGNDKAENEQNLPQEGRQLAILMRAQARVLQQLMSDSNQNGQDQKLIDTLLVESDNQPGAQAEIYHYRWLVTRFAEKHNAEQLRLLSAVAGVSDEVLPQRGAEREGVVLAEVFCALMLGHSRDYFLAVEQGQSSTQVPEEPIKIHVPNCVMNAFYRAGAKPKHAINRLRTLTK